MILKNKKLNREIEIDFSFFREEYADVIKEAFDRYREEKLALYPETFKTIIRWSLISTSVLSICSINIRLIMK